ncbi:MAG TPA: crosslink repair DNA glycosylase YcaQ family protein, partial [Candidatus Limnocylindrales bacterium]|nr:crosslink repair DNA glycosylase YcaQ family protein [Candidatus Limnocylindrales bacterium]
MTRLTERQLNRATLARQLLLERVRLPAVEAVRRIVALQAQEAASPYLALWNRVERFDPAELDRAFVEQTVVKATLMRITLHAVHVCDYPLLHSAMQPTLRAARLGDRRFRATGLSSADADALIPEVSAFAARPRSNAEVEAWLDERLGPTPKPGVWWALRQYGPFVHA